MPERKYKKVRRIDTADIQGEGSYIELKSFSWKELRALGFDSINLEDVNNMETADFAFKVAKTALVGWNWVDDNGDPLPDPAGHETLFDDLPSQEQTYIIKKLELAVETDKTKN